jgi:hypothetical protein
MTPILHGLAAAPAMRQAHAMSDTDSEIVALAGDILRVLRASDQASLSAPEIAHLIRPAGDWHALLQPIRRAAVELAAEGRLVIYRKGKPADPHNFSGVYRLGLPRHD